LLHAFPLNRAMWGPQVAALRDRFTVITPDLRGFGESDGPTDPWTIDEYAKDVLAMLDTLGQRRVVLGGCSMGGYVVFRIMAQAADRVSALVLADTRAEPDTAEAAEGRHRAAAQVRASGLAAFLDDFVPRLVAPGDEAARDAVRAIAEEQDPEAVARALEALAGRPDRLPDLPRIAVPTLVVVGSEDGLTPPSFSETLAAEIPDAELVVIEGSGHLTALERPQEFAAAVGAFLRASASP
jgi:pimeloyl-ACP methyl ester carboxylesterase